MNAQYWSSHLSEFSRYTVSWKSREGPVLLLAIWLVVLPLRSGAQNPVIDKLKSAVMALSDDDTNKVNLSIPLAWAQ